MPKEFWVTAPRVIEFRDYDEPPLGPGEVRIKSIMSGISHGTELGLYRGTTPFVDQDFDSKYRMFLPGKGRLAFPLSLGYEMVGEVIETAPDVDKLKNGDIVHGYLKHRETNAANAENLVLLPSKMEPDKAMFIALGVVALNSVHDASVKIGDEVAVFGLGVIGLIAVQLARHCGAYRIYAIDRFAKRCEMADNLGADVVIDPTGCDVAIEIKKRSERKGVDVAIECSGSYQALNEAIRNVGMSGKVVTVGYYQGNADTLQLGKEWHHNRLTLISSMGVWGCPHRDYPLWDYSRLKKTVVSMLEKGEIKTDGFITHRFPFNRIKDAYELIDQHPDDSIKVIITY